jgi:hypothetical protein
MRIDSKDLYHGAALTQIIEHDSFKALNKADHKYGHYQINTDSRLLVKHSVQEESWRFTFHSDDLKTLTSDNMSGFKTYLILVCSDKTICLLEPFEFTSLIDMQSNSQQWIQVTIPKTSMRVSGTKGELKHAIKHNSFPKRIFE